MVPKLTPSSIEYMAVTADTPLNYNAPDYLNVFVAAIRHL